MRSRAVAPATKYSQSAERAVGSSNRSTRTMDGSTALRRGVQCWRDSLFIDHPCRVHVAAVMCRQKVGISENRWNHIRYILVCAKIPELLQDFDVADRLDRKSTRLNSSH